MYTSSPNYKVPSPRYAQFITVFEKEVTAAQERIKKIEAMEYPYNIVREAMERNNLPNDSNIILSENGIDITILAISSDSMRTFDALVSSIGESLVKADIHKDGLPACVNGGNWHNMFRRWYGKNPRKDNKICHVDLTIDIPIEGLVDLEVRKEPYSYTNTGYKYSFIPKDMAVAINKIKEMTRSL
jgi:hypothetical protein